MKVTDPVANEVARQECADACIVVVGVTWKGADPVANEVARQERADACIVVVGMTWRNGKSWRCK